MNARINQGSHVLSYGSLELGCNLRGRGPLAVCLQARDVRLDCVDMRIEVGIKLCLRGSAKLAPV